MTSSSVSERPGIAVMGAGAVGGYFGGMLARAGLPVTLIGRRPHVEAIARDGLLLESIKFQERVAVAASTRAEAVAGAAVVLFAVKTVDTAEAARLIAPHLAPGAIVVSLQNGVDNVERLRAEGINALASVVYVAAAMSGPGHVKHSGRGDLVMGHPARQAEVARVAEMFLSAGVPCRIAENMEGEMWVKLLMNCAGNAATTLARANYGQLARHGETRKVLMAAIAEGMAVARAAGVQLPATDLAAAGVALAEALAGATSSTAQDIALGRRTEIASLNGYLVRRGAELGVPTPVNHTLFALVKLLEELSVHDRSAASPAD